MIMQKLSVRSITIGTLFASHAAALVSCGGCGVEQRGVDLGIAHECGDCPANNAPTIYWSDDMESGEYATGNFDQSGPWNSGDAWIGYNSSLAHGGNRCMMLTIDTRNGSAAVRLPLRRVTIDGRERLLPDEAYYSVWYRIPSGIETIVWWNVMDWKTAHIRPDGTGWSDPTYSLNFEATSTGEYRARLSDHVCDDGRYHNGNPCSGRGTIARSEVTWPADTWMHMECFYRWSTSPDGRITCWINGHLAWDVPNIVTQFDQSLTDYSEYHMPRQWKINHYSDGLRPSAVTIYIDDAVVADGKTFHLWQDDTN